ncbi:pantetheine-phosphate adenylyltransferase [Mycoplasma putrefaciens]|uniref:Phosphopantetheine adenylyltransferase n=2 Tax=Mycoplasma putrefaciens TaxID=2123 RepID=M9WGT3_9MOLU|nr:pantetheine-phosphate adenylyltransferase [Mycoplasma putrefaciens]AEM68903.1 Phosphopantetheine adenylyltransferase [Mycoplasma putrefaciens KS1]AGJ90609.1 Phosphopantetheine adenylyl transferase [Mycoplasma putrefaciens Mput9231]SYV96305.1 phosphopantetheine adenylyltransferase [Mycoplasma putrefaciens]
MKIAIYPGSFDPFHQGHLNVVRKASLLFDRLYIVVSRNINKTTSFKLDSRVRLITEVTKDIKNVEVIRNDDKLTTDIAKLVDAKYIIRGLRNKNDFDYELAYYDGFKSLDPNIEVIYFISSSQTRALSSSTIKEIEFFKKD